MRLFGFTAVCAARRLSLEICPRWRCGRARFACELRASRSTRSRRKSKWHDRNATTGKTRRRACRCRRGKSVRCGCGLRLGTATPLDRRALVVWTLVERASRENRRRRAHTGTHRSPHGTHSAHTRPGARTETHIQIFQQQPTNKQHIWNLRFTIWTLR